MSMRTTKAKQVEEEKKKRSSPGRIARSLYFHDAHRDFGLEIALSSEREIFALKPFVTVESFTLYFLMKPCEIDPFLTSSQA